VTAGDRMLGHLAAAAALDPTCGSPLVEHAAARLQMDDAPGAHALLDAAEGCATFLGGHLYHSLFEQRGIMLLRDGCPEDAADALRCALAYAPWTPTEGDEAVAEILVRALKLCIGLSEKRR
jgi:hypothetical protein